MQLPPVVSAWKGVGGWRGVLAHVPYTLTSVAVLTGRCECAHLIHEEAEAQEMRKYLSGNTNLILPINVC
jgi:hypothetical protein